MRNRQIIARLLAAVAAVALVLVGIAIGSGGGASANQLVQCSEMAFGACNDNVTIGGLTTEPTQDFGCPLAGGPTGQPCTVHPPERASGHLPLAPRGLLVINTPRLSDPRRPEPPVFSITVVLGFVPRHGTAFKRIVVRGRAHPNRRHTLWTFRLPRHIAGNELDLVLDGAAVEAFGVTTSPGCA